MRVHFFIQRAIEFLLISFFLAGCGGSSSSEKTTQPVIPTSNNLKISSIEIQDRKQSSVIVKWELNKYATAQVEYGETTNYGEFSIKEESFNYKVHTIRLTNLSQNTLYYYRVISEDSEGEKTVSETKTFRTLGNNNDTSTIVIPEIVTNTKYQKDISLPVCDASNPQVQMIEDISDWNFINDPDKTIFCLSPGDYSSKGAIKLTASGTASEPRYIILNNGNDKHPVQLNRTQLAKYRLNFTHADYWIVDRQAYWEDTTAMHSFVQLNKSSHNIFNRGLLQDTANGFTLYNGSHNNIIQKQHIEKTKWSVLKHNFEDLAAINLKCQNNGESIKNTIVVNNEIINYVDAFQTVRLYGAYKIGSEINFEGTIVFNNDMYVTNIMYSDGKGHSTTQGERSFTENAVDLKGGSSNPSNPIIVSNNRMWGYKTVDNTYSNIADAGNAMVVHYDVRNVKIENNIIFNSNNGLMGGGPLGNRYPLEDSVIKNNIFYNIKGNAISLYGNGKEGVYDGARNVDIIGNFFSKNKSKVIKLFNTNSITIENNIFSDSGSMWFGETSALGNKYRSSELSIINNHFYNMPKNGIASYAIEENNINSNQSVSYSNYDLVYSMGKFKVSPKVVKLF